MANAPINIVYPIDGGTYPINDPAAPSLISAYIALSFSATRKGGEYTVFWSIDNNNLGEAKFYDEISVQQIWKLPGGNHRFYVEMRNSVGAVLASDQVTFDVGS